MNSVTSRRPPAGQSGAGRSGARLMQLIGPYGSLLLGLSAVLLVWLGAVTFIQKERARTHAAALQNAGNLVRAFEEQLIRSIRAADQTLLYVRDSYARNRDRFDISLWNRQSQFLSDFTFQVAVIDEKGMMVASNIDPGAPRVDLSDREHFRVHADRKSDELFISAPVLGRVSKKWSIQLTRRVILPDGGFGGVIVVSLDPDYLSSFYQSINIGSRGSIAVIGMDGIVRARGASTGAAIGSSVAGGPLLQNLARRPEGFYTSASVLDGVERMFAYRKVSGYPLVVAVGLADDEVFSEYREDRRTTLLAATLLTLWLLLVTSIMSRYQRGLARTRDLAQAGTRARSDFLAMMSHEIRTPMNGVVGMADLLLDSKLNPEQAQLASTLKDSAEHLLQIINDVLDFSKLEADRVEIEQIGFEVARVVSGAIAIIAPRAKEKGLELRTEIAPDVPARVTGDPARLRQVLLNLIGNGVKFTNSGGVTVRVERPRCDEGNGDMLVFSVSDTGIGVSEEARGMLFREFSQLDSSIARRFGGTGLGLAICKRLVGLMGGEISVESEQGRGSRFRFTMRFSPDREAEMDKETPEALEPEPASVATDLGRTFAERGWRILLVEDNPTNQIVATKMLKALGLAADVAGNGVEAVTACNRVAYDLIFMDVMMPEMDGIAATQAIRRLPGAASRAWIVALTANALRGDEEVCRKAGMSDFLGKPFVLKELRQRLERFVAQAPRVSPAPDSVAAADAISDNAEPVFEKAVFEELAAMIGRDDARSVLDTFMADSRTRLVALARHAAADERAAVKREAHAFKSSAASLGFRRMSAQARSLEATAEAMSAATLAEAVAALSKSFAKACLAAEGVSGAPPALALAS